LIWAVPKTQIAFKNKADPLDVSNVLISSNKKKILNGTVNIQTVSDLVDFSGKMMGTTEDALMVVLSFLPFCHFIWVGRAH